MKKLLISSLIVCSSLVHAEETWTFFASSDVGTIFYINDALISKVGVNSRRTWSKAIYKNVKFRETVSGNKYIKEIVVLNLTDCINKTNLSLTETWYDVNGNVITPNNLIYTKEYIIPGTVGETKMNFVCAK